MGLSQVVCVMVGAGQRQGDTVGAGLWDGCSLAWGLCVCIGCLGRAIHPCSRQSVLIMVSGDLKAGMSRKRHFTEALKSKANISCVFMMS